MKTPIKFKKLNSNHFNEMLTLVKQLNPNKDIAILKQRLEHMLKSEAYQCFGVFKGATLIGLLGCWTFTKLYSGKQLELDNVIIDEKFQSKGYGKLFIDFIENWAKNNDYEALGLNTYVENARSHKFYFNQGFKILGFNFQKTLTVN